MIYWAGSATAAFSNTLTPPSIQGSRHRFLRLRCKRPKYLQRARAIVIHSLQLCYLSTGFQWPWHLMTWCGQSFFYASSQGDITRLIYCCLRKERWPIWPWNNGRMCRTSSLMLIDLWRLLHVVAFLNNLPVFFPLDTQLFGEMRRWSRFSEHLVTQQPFPWSFPRCKSAEVCRVLPGKSVCPMNWCCN